MSSTPGAFAAPADAEADEGRRLYIGLMSGTSMDGIDGVLVDLPPKAGCVVLHHVHQAFEPALRDRLFQLNTPGHDELHLANLASNGLAQAYALVVEALLAVGRREPAEVRAVGAHGQTVRHRPREFDRWGYTCQLLNGALLAELTGIDVICDFRSRDVAAGGQGAPLVPAFHRAMFALPGQDSAVLNLGGIANLSLLHADGRTSGHDCGPGNVLLDLWCQRSTGQAFDAGGAWSAQGAVRPELLQHLLREPFLQRSPPKSTGRDLFHMAWLEQQLSTAPGGMASYASVDVQATLTAFTVRTVVDDLHRAMPQSKRLLVCGGGAMNASLMAGLSAELPGMQVAAINEVFRIDPMEVEAAAFAWLAAQFQYRQTGNCTTVTGATGARILGALYPA